MNRYKNVHFWMILVFLVVFLGFARGYWSNFSSESFGHHLHMFSALAWFALVMSQPYLATHGNLKAHRRNGMIGLFVAGLVVASAALMLPGNIESAATAPEDGFVNPTFLYGVTFYDIVTITGFALAVLMAVLRSKKLDDHALWMIASVYMILGPGFSRLMVFPLVAVPGIENLDFIKVILFSTPLMLLFIGITAWRFKRLHPALLAAAVVNLAGFGVGPFGGSEAWRTFCESVFT